MKLSELLASGARLVASGPEIGTLPLSRYTAQCPASGTAGDTVYGVTLAASRPSQRTGQTTGPSGYLLFGRAATLPQRKARS